MGDKRPFPTYILENLQYSFIPISVVTKLWQLILFFPPCLNGLWIWDKTRSVGQRGNTLLPEDLSQGGLQSSSHTKLAPHSYHAKNNCSNNLDDNLIGFYCLMICALMWG